MSMGLFDTGVLRMRFKAVEEKVEAFESGEKYVQMQERFQATFREQNARIRRLECELGRAHAQTVSVRKKWSEIFDDVYREANAGKFALRKEIIPAPSIYKDDPNFKETGSTVRKQLVKLHVGVEVIEYSTPEFRNRITGQRVHADFPKGLKEEVTYDGTA